MSSRASRPEPAPAAIAGRPPPVSGPIVMHVLMLVYEPQCIRACLCVLMEAVQKKSKSSAVMCVCVCRKDDYRDAFVCLFLFNLISMF